MDTMTFLTLTSDTHVPAHLHPNHHDDSFRSTHEPEVHMYNQEVLIQEVIKPRYRDVRTKEPASTVASSSDSGRTTDDSSSDLSFGEQYPSLQREVSADSTEMPRQEIEAAVATSARRSDSKRGSKKERRGSGATDKKPRLSKLLGRRLSWFS